MGAAEKVPIRDITWGRQQGPVILHWCIGGISSTIWPTPSSWYSALKRKFDGGLGPIGCRGCTLLDSRSRHAPSCMTGGYAVLLNNSIRHLACDLGRLSRKARCRAPLLRWLPNLEDKQHPADVLVSLPRDGSSASWLSCAGPSPSGSRFCDSQCAQRWLLASHQP